MSLAEYTAALVEQGVGQAEADSVTAMSAMMERGVIAGTTDGVATVLGRDPDLRGVRRAVRGRGSLATMTARPHLEEGPR